MRPNKCTLLIDGNWLLISRFSVMKNLFLNSLSTAELDRSTEKLKDMMARSINSIINRLPMVDNIIFISDGGSWRKQLPIPHQLEDITYKGNRDGSKDSKVSWSHVFKALNEIAKVCDKQGITTCTQSNIEGDDWVWYWSRRLNAEGVNCIVWSSDHDLMQLIQNTDGVFTAWFYERSGKAELALHNTLQVKNPDPDDLDFFMQPMIIRERLLDDLEHRASKVTYINPNEIINDKVICGDSGDNIKSVVRVMINDRKYGVGQKEWNKISERLNIVTITDLINHKNEIAKEISLIKKFHDKRVTIHQILEMIDYNVKLVWLNESVIPDTVIDVMNNHDYKTIDIEYFRGSYKTLLDDDTDVMDIFASI